MVTMWSLRCLLAWSTMAASVVDLPEPGAATVLLHEIVGAKTRHARDLVAEVDVAGLFELLDGLLGRDLVEHRAQRLVVHRIVFDPLEVAVHPQDRGLSRGDVQVGGARVEHQLEEGVEPGHVSLLVTVHRARPGAKTGVSTNLRRRRDLRQGFSRIYNARETHRFTGVPAPTPLPARRPDPGTAGRPSR